MTKKQNGEIVYESISKAVSFKLWWHRIIYIISLISILYLSTSLNFNLEGVNILFIVLISLFLSFFALFIITFLVLLIVFIVEKFLAFLNFSVGRSLLKLFLSFFEKNYGFSYSDYPKYLIINTKNKLEEPLNRGVYLDEIKKSVKELKFEFVKIKNTLNQVNMSDLNPLFVEEIKSVINSLEEILQLKTITLDNKKEIIEYLDELEQAIVSEDFKGLNKISLKFDETYKDSYLDKMELLFKLIPKKYFYGLIFFIIFILLTFYTSEQYKNILLIIYTFIVIIVLCFIRKD